MKVRCELDTESVSLWITPDDSLDTQIVQMFTTNGGKPDEVKVTGDADKLALMLRVKR